MRSVHYTVERSKLTLKMALEREKVRGWASKNAYTLIFLSFMFIVTWMGMVLLFFLTVRG